jgi:pimeloyl-ACP methyl ester carboxylesterase
MPLDVRRAPPPDIAGHDRPRAPLSRGRIALAGAALALGGLALGVGIMARRAARRYPPQGTFITVDGVRLHYVERGSGRTLVLLHGMGSMLQDFSTSILDELARHYRVIAFDRPGYGHSGRPGRMVWTPSRQARLIHMALTRLGVEKPIVLGHSWGGLIALAYALAYPQQTAAIVLLGSYVFPVPRPDVALAGVFRLPVLGRLLSETLAPLIMRLTEEGMLREVAFAPNPIPPRFSAEFPLALTWRPAQIRAMAEEALMLQPAAATLARRYGEIIVPTVIVAGESDRVVDQRRHALPLHRAIRHSSIRMVPRTGHMVQHARPDIVLDAVETVRQQVETAS